MPRFCYTLMPIALHFPGDAAQTPDRAPSPARRCPARAGVSVAESPRKPALRREEAGHRNRRGRKPHAGAIRPQRGQGDGPAADRHGAAHRRGGTKIPHRRRAGRIPTRGGTGRPRRAHALHDARLCRLPPSEALALTADRVDLTAGVLTFESLKKGRTGICRSVPIPPALLDALDLVHGIRELQTRRGRGVRLWPWSRMAGWRAVREVMGAARLEGPHASPKGLRHAFGVAAVSAGIPLNLVQKWLGHAQLTTTAIYANAVGAEDKDMAQRMW